jgi:hypothetical protein
MRGEGPILKSGAIIALLGVGVLAAGSAGAATTSLCIGGKPGCLATIQAAIDVAQDGDTIAIGTGTFPGGIEIEKSVNLVGVAAAATIIEGGGPVITIGEFHGATGPTVSIARVTITGGLNDSSPVTFGGGVWIPADGATVTISDSVITQNRVTPRSTLEPGPFCGPIPCAFALGGGIDNSGTLTVTSTRITDNSVGATEASPSVASGVFGGGIVNHPEGSLTLTRSLVSGNRVAATAPNGQLAVAGGISDNGVLKIEDSVVRDNTVEVDAAFAGEVNAFTGGIEVTGDASATITRTIVRGNRVRATNATGNVLAGVGGISTDKDVSLDLSDSAVEGNRVDASVAAVGATVITFAGGLEIEGDVDVSGSRFIGNEVRASSPAALSVAVGGGIQSVSVEEVSVTDSIVVGNEVYAETASGFAIGQGGGVFNGGLLTLERTRVAGNTASANGPAGLAQGGGMWNGVVDFPGFPPVAALTLVDSTVAGNALAGSPGVELQGGGLFTTLPVTSTGSAIVGNRPDDCFGC